MPYLCFDTTTLIKNYFVTLNNQIHEHNTRKLHRCYKMTNYVKHTLSNKGVDVWNSLETKLNEINCYSTFKKQIKQHFFAIHNYQYIKQTTLMYIITYTLVYCSPIIVKIKMNLQH